MFRIADGRKSFYQWDVNRQIIVEDPTITEVHFCNKTDDCSLVVEVYADPLDSEVKANVPNILLQNDFPIRVYAYCNDGYTKIEETFKVITRTRPSDYIYTETEIKTVEESLAKAVKELEESNKDILDNAFSDLTIYKTGNELSIGRDIEYKGRDIHHLLVDVFATELNPDETPVGIELRSGSSIKLYDNSYNDYITLEANRISIDSKGEKGKVYLNGDVRINDSKPVTEETITPIIDKAIANIEIPEANIPKDITVDSIVIGQGVVSDLSIAGGTTNIDTYAEKAGLTTTEILALKAALALNGGVKESKATAPLSIALGANNESTSSGAISLGYGNTNSGFNSTAVGAMNTVTGDSAFAYGYKNTVNGDFGTVVGQENIVGEMGFAGGVKSQATGKGSIAFGNENTASEEYAVALGGDTTASGKRSFASGTNTTASGKYSHAQNEETTASGESSTAMGYRTEASGNQAFAGGRETIASARNSTALGFKTEANHDNSFTTGRNLTTGRENQTVVGEYNAVSTDALFIVGNGTAGGSNRNAFEVKDNNTAYLNGKPIATENYVNNAISNIDIPKTDLTDYYTKDEVDILISDIDIPASSSSNIYYIDPSRLTQDGNRFILTDDLKEFADKVVADDTVLLKIYENNSWCETVVYKFSDTYLLIKRRDLTVDDLHKDAGSYIKGYEFIKDDNGWYLCEYAFTFQVDVASKKYVDNAIPDVSNFVTETEVNTLISSALAQIGVAEGGSY